MLQWSGQRVLQVAVETETRIVNTSLKQQSEGTETPVTSNDPSDPHSCDLGLWPDNILNSRRKYWATKGSSNCSNSDADFSATLLGDKYKQQ